MGFQDGLHFILSCHAFGNGGKKEFVARCSWKALVAPIFILYRRVDGHFLHVPVKCILIHV